uniref:AlNc14C213G8952 protein n=1 Tax=Albugo laibachii Nc14 TaxID=890382 RepID=F0WRE9_9STRA|nr:AlNc14C213G8952 [Albugo laibachii Nc14]|eukprot:CCA23912.1 AlNc14C213G8952 [Albugo laibachii Nc14]
MLNLYFPDIPGTKATDTRQLKSFVILTGVMYMLRVVSDDNSSSKFARKVRSTCASSQLQILKSIFQFYGCHMVWNQ